MEGPSSKPRPLYDEGELPEVVERFVTWATLPDGDPDLAATLLS